MTMAVNASFTITLFAVCVSLTVCVLVLNLLSIVAIVRTRGVRVSHSNMFILNLAIVDILMMGPQLFFGTCALKGDIALIGLIFNTACFFTLTMAAMLNTFAIAIDRFLFIKQAMRYPSIVTSGRVRLTVLIIWLLAIVIGTISLYDIPFHQFANDGVYQIYPDCQNTTVQWLKERNTQEAGNLSTYMQKIGFWEEADMTLLLHQIAACPEAVRPALRIQNMIIFVSFCIMGVITLVLYIQVFFVIRNHKMTLATHANLRSTNSTNEQERPKCRICSKCEENIIFTKSTKVSSTEVNKHECRVKNLSTSGVFDTSLCLRIFKNNKHKTGKDETDVSRRHATFSSTASSSTIRLSQNSSSTISSHIVPTNDKDGERKTGADYSYDSDSSLKKEEITAELKPAVSARCIERKNRIKLSVRNRFHDMRTVKTLGTMFVIYYICWLPMIICSFTLYGILHPITEQALLGAWIMGTSNSVWNFLVYPMRNRELRSAITRLVCFHRSLRDKS